MNTGTIVWYEHETKDVGVVVDLGFSPESVKPIHRIRKVDAETGDLMKCREPRCRGKSLHCWICGCWKTVPVGLSVREASEIRPRLSDKILKQHTAALKAQEKQKAL